MAMRVIGAGLPRTGTSSLKAALAQLLNGRCYHMVELWERDEDIMRWVAALNGNLDDLALLDSWDAAVDWPASCFWRPLMERHPNAIVLLSHRGSAETWWQSADATVWEAMRRTEAAATADGASDIEKGIAGFNQTMRSTAGFSDDLDDAAAAMARYDSHFAEVVQAVPANQLVIWQPSDGWEPICAALGVPVPTEPFGHQNKRDEFRERAGIE